MASRGLTETFIKSVKTAGVRKEYKDGHTSGLYLVVQASGSKGWVWRYRRPSDNKQDKMTLGAYPAFMLTDARDWADENNRMKGRGVDPKLERATVQAAVKKEAVAKAAHDEQTLGWYWSTYCLPDWIDGLKNGAGERDYWTRFTGPALGHMKITDIEHDALAHIIDKARKHAPSTANKLVTFYKTLWKKMLTQHRHVVVNRVNAAEYLVKPTIERARERTLDKRELGYVLRVAGRLADEKKASNHRTFARGLRLIAAVGCRREEAFGATWEQFDLVQGTWLQSGSQTKNGQPNLLYLPAPILAMLKEMRARDQKGKFVFRQGGEDKSLNAYSKSMDLFFREAAARAKADGFEMQSWSLHDLRRTLATELRGIKHPGTIRPIVSDAVVEAILNHVDGAGKKGVAKVYNRYAYVEEKAAAIQVWQGYLDEAIAEEIEREIDRPALPPVPRFLNTAGRKAA